jgi:coenzyme F420-reducing hydrogenase gamma subunit
MDIKKKALLESAEHWLKNYDLIEKGETDGIDYSRLACECCRHWFDKGLCTGCPIKEFTGESYCQGTPYSKAKFAIDDWLYNYGNTKEAILAAVGKEYTFLVELALK